ncbi:uncharacterized protein METZ01_LOCUS243461 [marine metagenome]|uniref:Uncharacterized protein n=1 Tax=marine metagenome TaxID=408172 RepID=A0A382HUM2_9ZZZZ
MGLEKPDFKSHLDADAPVTVLSGAESQQTHAQGHA